MNSSIRNEMLFAIRDKMYGFITKYHLVNPLDDDTFSAYSMFLAFAVLYPGASGETKKQLEDVFGFNELADDFEKSIAFLSTVKNLNTFALENTLWIDKKLKITKTYEETVSAMQSTLNSADFSTQPEEERVRINKHVEVVTHDLIKSLIPPNSIKTNTRLIITNAIYFGSKWKKEFQLMELGINFNASGVVKSMKVISPLKVTLSENVTTVSVPYKISESDYSYFMTIIMPKDMKSFEQSSDFKQMDELVSTNIQKFDKKTELAMPLFKLEKTADLKGRLLKLGLVDTFKSTANFNDITNELFVSDVLHKAYICVNEKETVAAASTATFVKFGCALNKQEPIKIVIDKPFFAIISRTDALPLFFSKVTNPKY